MKGFLGMVCLLIAGVPAHAAEDQPLPVARFIVELDGLTAGCGIDGRNLRYSDAPMTEEQQRTAVAKILKCGPDAIETAKKERIYRRAVDSAPDPAVQALIRSYYTAWQTYMGLMDPLAEVWDENVSPAAVALDQARNELKLETDP